MDILEATEGAKFND